MLSDSFIAVDASLLASAVDWLDLTTHFKSSVAWDIASACLVSSRAFATSASLSRSLDVSNGRTEISHTQAKITTEIRWAPYEFTSNLTIATEGTDPLLSTILYCASGTIFCSVGGEDSVTREPFSYLLIGTGGVVTLPLRGIRLTSVINSDHAFHLTVSTSLGSNPTCQAEIDTE